MDSLLGVMVHPAALELHCRTCPTVFLPCGFQVGGGVNASPDPDAGSDVVYADLAIMLILAVVKRLEKSCHHALASLVSHLRLPLQLVGH